jgi:hypothetical protein
MSFRNYSYILHITYMTIWHARNLHISKQKLKPNALAVMPHQNSIMLPL